MASSEKPDDADLHSDDFIKHKEQSRGAEDGGTIRTRSSTTQQTRHKKSRLLRWLVVILFALLLILVSLLGWLWWSEHNTGGDSDASGESSMPVQTEPMPEAEVNVCGDGLASYRNASLGLQFCYLEEWGTVAVADAKLDPSDTGVRQNLSFSNKNEVNLGVASADWSTTAGGDGVCSDPATPVLPPFTPYSTSWDSFDDGSGVTSVDRGIQKMDGQYLINEYASTTLAEVVCLTGYRVLDGAPFTHATGSYATTFNDAIPNPSAHAATPNVLIPAADRGIFYEFIKSIDNF